MVFPDAPCKMDDCVRKADQWFYIKIEVPFFGEKEIKLPFCNEHHAMMVRNKVAGLSIGHTTDIKEN